MYDIFLQLVSELSVEDLGEPVGLTMWELVYAWELPGVTGNACNGLTPTVALQLAAVVYGANLFSEPLEDLNVAWLLECLRTLVEGLAFVRVIGFVTGGETALFLNVKIIQRASSLGRVVGAVGPVAMQLQTPNSVCWIWLTQAIKHSWISDSALDDRTVIKCKSVGRCWSLVEGN
eukprot:Gb_05596 [translate_table: standard]